MSQQNNRELSQVTYTMVELWFWPDSREDLKCWGPSESWNILNTH